ncbi:asparagine synthase-related protein [Streptomyces sp. JNUCC 64]
MPFAVLPDHPVGEALAARLTAPDGPLPGGECLPHASGRPWIVGRWDPGDPVTTGTGPRRLALLGCTTTDTAPLRTALAAADGPAALDRLARTLPGAAHLVATLDGHVRAQGTVSALRQIHHTRIDGVTVAADRPDLLAALTGAGVDPGPLARRLLAPLMPWPLGETPLWRGVTRLPGDHYLHLRPDGTHRAHRWWSPPDPVVPLVHEGAAVLRARLAQAVAVRTRAGGTLSADLSGGLDSTSVCLLVGDRGPARLVTNRWQALDPANDEDDGHWARVAARALPGAEHVLTPHHTVPSWYEDVTTSAQDPEGPFPSLRTQAQQLAQVRLMAEHGSTRHLTGHGGDELFTALPAHLHSHARTDPLAALPHLRATAALQRWGTLATLTALGRDQPYHRWLAGLATTLTSWPPRPGRPDFGWGATVLLPPWATSDAADTVRAALRAPGARPLAEQRGQHTTLELVRQCGQDIRRLDQFTTRHGVRWHAPYLDDRVLEAVLSLRVADRADTSRAKRPLAEAMRDTAPAGLFERDSKAEFSREAYTGLKRHRHTLAALCDDLRLARLGLVDADALREAILGLHPRSLAFGPLDRTLACEVWLRSLPAPALPARTPAPLGGTR